MRVFRVALVLGTGLLASITPAQLTAQCPADGRVQFICDVPGAEDLIAVPESPWVLVSSRVSADDGHLMVVDSRDMSTSTL